MGHGVPPVHPVPRPTPRRACVNATVDGHLGIIGGTSPQEKERRDLLKALWGLQDKEILMRILEDDAPEAFVRGLSPGDLYWLIKRIGEDDCIPLLELASEEQWQHILDLEIWRRDIPDPTQLAQWVQRLQMADCPRLVRWFYTKGESMLLYHLFKSLDVIVLQSKEETFDVPPEHFTLDGLFFLKARDDKDRETLQTLISLMAAEDLLRYQAALLSLEALLPTEHEEDMYRMRSLRLAEWGFLPFEEAMAVYAPLGPEALVCHVGEECEIPGVPQETPPPLLPVLQEKGGTLFHALLKTTEDPLLLERLALEFAGLCNQVLSAGVMPPADMGLLSSTATRVSSTLNLAVERYAGSDLTKARELIRRVPLLTLFRVGFGLILKVKWEAERWVRTSWYTSQGLTTFFWGDAWGNGLALLRKHWPRRHVGDHPSGDEGVDFAWLSELGATLQDLHEMFVIDALLQSMTTLHPVEPELLASPELTFRTLLLTFWARCRLGLPHGFSPLHLEEVQGLLLLLGGEGTPCPRFPLAEKTAFVETLLAFARRAPREEAEVLRSALADVWEAFEEEYAGLPAHQLSRRYSRDILIA